MTRTILVALALAGCSSSATEKPVTASSSPPSATAATSTPSAPAPTNALTPSTSYAALLDELAASKASAGCLLRGPAGARGLGTSRQDVEGTSASPARFTEVEGSPTFSVGLWTPHGTTRQVTREAFDRRLARAPVDHWLATVTPVSVGAMQQRAVPLLWVTADALWFSAIVTSGVVGETWQQLEGEELERFHDVLPKVSAVVVTADPDVTLTRLEEAIELAKLGDKEVALAVTVAAPPAMREDGVVDHVEALPKDTPGICRTGIGDIPPGLQPGSGFGVMKRVEDFDATLAKACAGSVPKTSAGGTVHIALRIMKDGKARDACVSEDPIGDEALRNCLLDHAKRYRFPTIEDGDFQNVGLGVTLRPPGGIVTSFCAE